MSITTASVGNYKSTTRQKNVLIIVQNLPVPFDKRVWQEACELQRNGYNVHVICPKGRGYTASHEQIEGVHIYRHPQPLEAKGAVGYILEYSWSLFWEFLLAWKVFLKHGFDIIHACNPPDTIFLIAGFFKYLFGKKFIFDHHDINPELYEAKFNRRDFFYKLLIVLERLTFAVADISIATNNSYKRIATKRGKMPADKVFVVRSGPDLSRLKIIPAQAELKYGRNFLIGYVGIIGQQEGLEYLLQAARHIIHQLGRRDIHFTIIGDGPAFKEMRILSNQYNIDHRVNFTGRVSDNTMLSILNTADICVNPDAFNDMNDKSTMNKIMEYMALGKPIVQFDVTEGRYSAGAASLYANPNDAIDFAAKIIELIDDPQKREIMGVVGRKRIEQELCWPHEAPKLLQAYTALFPSEYAVPA